MCLRDLQPIEKTSGLCVKVVRTTNKPDEFRNQWDLFDKEGDGGAGITAGRNLKKYFRSGITYKVDRTYRVKHNHIARSVNMKLAYPALVHCYKSLKRAEEDMGIKVKAGGFVYLICKYSGGQYQDATSLTAKYITPLFALTHKQAHMFKELMVEFGFDKAVNIILTAKTIIKGE